MQPRRNTRTKGDLLAEIKREILYFSRLELMHIRIRLQRFSHVCVCDNGREGEGGWGVRGWRVSCNNLQFDNAIQSWLVLL